MNHRQSFLKGALILSAAGAISKILGAIYRIPLARLIGAEGIGLYQMAYPIYTTILALATAGVPVAISILIARKETQGFPGESRRILRVSLLLLAVFRMLLTLLVMASAKFLALHATAGRQGLLCHCGGCPGNFSGRFDVGFPRLFSGPTNHALHRGITGGGADISRHRRIIHSLSAVSRGLEFLRPGPPRRGCGRFGRIAGFAVVLPLAPPPAEASRAEPGSYLDFILVPGCQRWCAWQCRSHLAR